MRAIVVQPDPTDRLVIQEVPDPVPGKGELLVEVKAYSLNRGEVRMALAGNQPGSRPGWDLAGVVAKGGDADPGFPPGTRVVGYLPEGSWAEKAAVPTRNLAVLPDRVTLAQAATLPVAGLTALHALREGGLLLGKKVLVNGAAGGVGHFALQLASASGAHVTAAVHHESRRGSAVEDGAHEVVVTSDLAEAREGGPYDLVLESVGGPALARAVELTAPGGTCVVFGRAHPDPSAIPSGSLFFPGGGRRITGLFILSVLERESAGEGLSLLLRLVSERQLKPRIAVAETWTRTAEVATAFIRDGVAGKVVMLLD